MFPQLTNSMVLANEKSMHLVLNMFIFTRTLVTYARTIFKPRCCLNFQSMRTQADSSYIAHNMFGQINIEKPWYINQHTLTSRKRDGKLRMISCQLVVVHGRNFANSMSLPSPPILCFKSCEKVYALKHVRKTAISKKNS